MPSQGSNRMYRDTVDTLMVRRGNHFFVHNDNSTDVADHDFTFGNPDDVVLVGDWAQQSWSTGEITTSSDGADQIVVRRGNTYIESQDFRWTPSGIPVFAGRSYMYWDVTDTAFTARLEWLDVPKGGYNTYTGDGLAVRR